MVSANVELVRAIYAAWERGDFSSAEWADPNIEFVLADGPDPQTTIGLSGMAHAWGDVLRVWEAYSIEGYEPRELDDERVFVHACFGGRGKTSGLDTRRLGARGAAIFHLERHKVTRIVAYMDVERALDDLGLAPETDSPDS